VPAKDDCDNWRRLRVADPAPADKGQLDDLVVGKIVLTQPGCRGFKRANPWLTQLDFLPYTILYASGEKVDEFAGSKGTYLLERAADIGFI
jgi:hypothetical protein